MQEKIIDFLKKKDGYISGDYMSQRLGITRQALWKHIQELKEMGYDIVAVPHLGYRLVSVPDKLFACEVMRQLKTKIIGKKIVYFDRIGSTMDAAWRMGLAQAAEGTVIIAESQSKGKGRLGREWISPKYKGIYFSLILKPRIMPSQAPLLTLLAAVSMCEAVREETGVEALIKWPNDIYVGDRKVGGILTELSAETDRVNFAVVGVGINVNNEEQTLPPSATSLKQVSQAPVDRLSLLRAAFRNLEKDYQLINERGTDVIIQRWRDLSLTLGRRVRVNCQNEVIEGEALDIEGDGGLLIRKDSGVTRKVMAGDVVLCR